MGRGRIEWWDSRGADGEGVVLYRLPRPAPDGRIVIRLSPLELLDRLAARPACGGCPPPPRMHRHRYHGVLAPNSPLRSAVVASAGEVPTLPVPQTTPPRPVSTLSRRRARSHSRRVSSRWAALLARGPPELKFGCAEPSADEMDQTPAVDPAEPEPIPPYEMDQTRSW